MSDQPTANGLDEVLVFLEARTEPHQLSGFALEIDEVAQAAQRHYFNEAICRCALWRADDLTFGDGKRRQGYLMKLAFHAVGDSVNTTLKEHQVSYFFTRDDDDKIIDVLQLRTMTVH